MWTPGHDLTLLMKVTKLKTAGKSELQAIKRIVSNPRTKQLFPYREQKNRRGSHHSLQNEIKRREAALWRRLQFLKASSTEKSILNQLLGPGWDTQSHIGRTYLLDFPAALSKVIMKNKNSSR